MSDFPVWLITGCSGGLGLALARAVLAHDHRLIASSRNPSKTPDLVDEITSRGGHWIALDSTAANLEEIVSSAQAIHGHLDVVVNNAGYPICGAFEDLRYMPIILSLSLYIPWFQPFKSRLTMLVSTRRVLKWKPTSGAPCA